MCQASTSVHREGGLAVLCLYRLGGAPECNKLVLASSARVLIVLSATSLLAESPGALLNVSNHNYLSIDIFSRKNSYGPSDLKKRIAFPLLAFKSCTTSSIAP